MFAAFSCNKETGIEVPASGTIVFTATLDQPVKATLDAYKVCWEAGDVIAVYNGTTWADSTPITADDIDETGRTATFAVSIAEGSSYTLVYPASARSETALPAGSPTGAIMLTLPADQVIPAGGVVDPSALVQIGTSTTPNKVTFKNAVSLVELKVPDSDIHTIVLQADNSAGDALKITGDAVVLPEPGFTAGSKSSIKVSGSFTSGQNYFAVVWPQETVGAIHFVFAKGSGASARKARRTGTSAAGFSLPVSGGKKFENIGNLNWFNGVIRTKADLDFWASIAELYLADETVSLGADIDYGGGAWTPVSGNENSGHFAGLFDGAGHCIYNIVLGTTSEYGGFFSIVASPENRLRVKDLTLGKKNDGSSLLVNDDKVKYAGALAARMKNVTLSNVKNYIPVKVEKAYAGFDAAGLVGQIMNDSGNSITNCHNYADISIDTDAAGNNYYGGIVGLISGKATITDCSNSGKISRNKASSKPGVNTFGGIAGRTGNNLDGAVISNCKNSGTVETTANILASQLYYGGIIGMDGSNVTAGTANLTVLNCTNEGAVNCFDQSAANKKIASGGIIGFSSKGNTTIIRECTNLGIITKLGDHVHESCFGGIIGYNASADCLIDKCTNGKNGNDTAGGVINVEQTTNVNMRYGGIEGFAERGTCTDCINYGPVTSLSSAGKTYAGGIAGNATVGKIRSCSNFGTITVTAETAVDTHSAGGIIGLQNGSSNDNFTGEDCYVSASITSCYAGSAGLVVGRFSNSINSGWGTEAKPVKISKACSVNGTAITSDNYQTYLAGIDYGITASGVTSGNNTIWAVFE